MKKFLLLIALVSCLSHAQTRTMKLDADCVRIQDGTCIDKTEFGYLDGVTANIQYQLDNLGSSAESLINKTIDADQNTITNIENADIKAAAAIDATKIADGSVSNTEFQYLDGATANIQYQIDQLTANSALDSDVVHTTGNESVAGVKTFTGKMVTSSTANGSTPCPVMTAAQRDSIASPASGDCVFNSTSLQLNVYNGTTWSASGGGISNWVTSFNYVTGDVVIQSSKIYQAQSSHTSGTFATDLGAGKWVEISSVNMSQATGTLPISNGGTNSSTALSGSSIMVSDGSKIVQGAAGTSTTVLHGNASGSPTYSAVSMANDVTGTLGVANGGTGAATLTSNNVLLGNGTSAVQFVAPGTSGNVLKSNGTTWVSDTLTAGTNQVISTGASNPNIQSMIFGTGGGCGTAACSSGNCSVCNYVGNLVTGITYAGSTGNYDIAGIGNDNGPWNCTGAGVGVYCYTSRASSGATSVRLICNANANLTTVICVGAH